MENPRCGVDLEDRVIATTSIVMMTTLVAARIARKRLWQSNKVIMDVDQ